MFCAIETGSHEKNDTHLLFWESTFQTHMAAKSNDALVNTALLKVIVYQNKVIIRTENRNQNLLRS